MSTEITKFLKNTTSAKNQLTTEKGYDAFKAQLDTFKVKDLESYNQAKNIIVSMKSLTKMIVEPLNQTKKEAYNFYKEKDMELKDATNKLDALTENISISMKKWYVKETQRQQEKLLKQQEAQKGNDVIVVDKTKTIDTTGLVLKTYIDVEITDLDAIPAEYVRVIKEPKLNELKQAYKDGKQVAGVIFKERKEME